MKNLAMMILLAFPLSAQRISLGLTAGVAIAQPGPSYQTDESLRLTGGVSLETRLTKNLSLDVNPLYKRLGSRIRYFVDPALLAPNNSLLTEYRYRAHSLEVPVIVKYTFRDVAERWRPFAGVGVAVAHAWTDTRGDIVDRDQAGNLSSRTFTASLGGRQLDGGAVAAAGVRIRSGRFEIAPEVRYTRWLPTPEARAANQADALFTIRF